MFPYLVKFTWKDPNGRTVQASEGGDELLEQRDDQETRITSMLIVDQSKVNSQGYTCFVNHETGETNLTIPKGTTKFCHHVYRITLEYCQLNRYMINEPAS